MKNLIKNELLKLSRKSKVYIVIAFLAISTVIQTYLQYNKIIAKSPERIIEECNNLIESLKGMTIIQSGGNGEATVDVESWVDKTIEDAKKEIERAQKELENKNKDWRERLREKIKIYEEIKEEETARGNLEAVENVNTIINMYKYHLEHDIKPDEEYKMNNTVILDIITYIGNVFLAIAVMMLTVDTIAVENSPATIKLLLTKPVSRGKIYISKFVTSLIVSLGIVIAIEAIAYLIIGILFEFGNLNAPSPIGPRYESDPVRIARYGMGVKPILGSTILVPVWQKLAILLFLQILFIIAVTSLGMLISVITKNGVSSTILGFLITAVLTVITVQINDIGQIKIASTLLPYLFSTYSAGGLILSGFLSSSLSSPLISASFAAFIMIAWSVFFFIFGYKYFVKKDILA